MLVEHLLEDHRAVTQCFRLLRRPAAAAAAAAHLVACLVVLVAAVRVVLARQLERVEPEPLTRVTQVAMVR